MNVCLPSPYGEAENQTVQSSAKLLDLLGRGKRQSEICVARSLNRPLDRCSWMLDVSKPMGSEQFASEMDISGSNLACLTVYYIAYQNLRGMFLMMHQT